MYIRARGTFLVSLIDLKNPVNAEPVAALADDEDAPEKEEDTSLHMEGDGEIADKNEYNIFS